MAFRRPLGHDVPRGQRDENASIPSQEPSPVPTRGAPLERAMSLSDTQIKELNDEALSRRQIVFPDPLAFRYLQDDPCVKVVERRAILRGYELYLVEQWACSRQSPTLVVVTFTGDEEHSVVVGVLAIPEDQSLWSTKLAYYLKATHQHHARPKSTELGELMVTNLSSFPSALTVIPVPDGDIRNHRTAFAVNENLKRLGCSGRSGLALTEPTQATQKKFQSLYKTNDKIPFMQSVTELIKLCQVALWLFEMLEQEYIDGLLCDVTETAIGNWWTEIGAEHYNFEPTDGILGPTTVAALLGMLMGSRNRLHWYGAPVTKDVFDVDATKRGIVYFQKAQKLGKTSRFDRRTLFRLQTASAKAAAGEGWGVQKAVKSTVSEIGGKRGEIVIDMVSGKDRGGLADIETLDLGKFVSLVYGERPKWLWHGKPRRTQIEPNPLGQDLVNSSPSARDDGIPAPIKKNMSIPLEEDNDSRRRQEIADGVYPQSAATYPLSNVESSADRDALRKTVFKSVAGKMSDARSGLGRIKDAVGGSRRNHGHTRGPSTASVREEYVDSAAESLSSSVDPTTGPDPGMPSRAFTWKNKPEEYLNGLRKGDASLAPGWVKESMQSRDPSSSDQDSLSTRTRLKDSPKSQGKEAAHSETTTGMRNGGPKKPSSSLPSEPDTTGLRLAGLDDHMQTILGRRHSMDDIKYSSQPVLNEARWPRRTSFSNAEEAVLGWDEIIDASYPGDELTYLIELGEIAVQLKEQVDDIVFEVEPWVQEQLRLVDDLNERYAHDQDSIDDKYALLSEACQKVRSQATEMLSEERVHLTENIKEIEVFIARLDYEINTVVQKVQDVDDGVQNFERQVEEVERRANELKVQLETESWLHWVVRTLTGIGTGPNITQEKAE